MTNKQVRQLVFDKYRGRCAYCGCPLEKGWHIDHIRPLGRYEKLDKKTGKYFTAISNPQNDRIGNYNPACRSCNIMKSNNTIERFRQIIQEFVNSLNQYSTQYKFAKRYGLVRESGIRVTFYFERL